MEERNARHESPDKERGSEPHRGHDRPEEDRKRPPLFLEVPGGQLHAGENELHAEHEAREVENDSVETRLRAAVS